MLVHGLLAETALFIDLSVGRPQDIVVLLYLKVWDPALFNNDYSLLALAATLREGVVSGILLDGLGWASSDLLFKLFVKLLLMVALFVGYCLTVVHI